jgi:alkylation response protein AidB-like acyl-CoA dehydrogenase
MDRRYMTRPGDAALIETAERLANEVLFPAALATDAAERVPEAHFARLAREGLFALSGPRRYGGLEVGGAAFAAIVEALASGCLATAFVWIQHHGTVQALAAGSNAALAAEWLPLLCAGTRRAGVALSGLRPGPSQLRARPVAGGLRLYGRAPWVTGWSMVDVLLTPVRTHDDQTLTLLLDAHPGDGVQVIARPLVAANASATVELGFDSFFVPSERIVRAEPYAELPPHDGGGRPNGSLALGVTRRACTLIGPSALDRELDERRAQLDGAGEHDLARARAAAVELALRASAAAITTCGSRSIALDQHAQRLGREALFLLVFGSRPAIRAALLAELGVAATTSGP